MEGYETDFEIGIQIALFLVFILGIVIYLLIKKGYFTNEFKEEAANYIEDSSIEERDPNPLTPKR